MNIKRMEFPILFLIGGFIYGALEIIAKGDTHFSMFIVGGLCFVLIDKLNKNMPLISRMFAGAVIITALEFISGCVVNIWLKLNVWSYSHLPLNIMGQVCLLFTVIWFFLSLPGILLGGYLEWRLFGESKPNYKIAARIRERVKKKRAA